MTPRPELQESPMLVREPEEKKETDAEFGARLATPIPKDRVKQRQGPGGKKLDYITARTVMWRLTEVAGPGGWETDLRELANGRGFLCRLSVKYPSGWRHREDGSDESDIEAEKGGMSGALKRAAVQHGIGMELYGDAPKPKPAPKPRAPAKPKPATDAEERAKIKEILSQVEKAETVDALRAIWTDDRAFIEALPEKDMTAIKDLAFSRKHDLETAAAQ